MHTPRRLLPIFLPAHFSAREFAYGNPQSQARQSRSKRDVMTTEGPYFDSGRRWITLIGTTALTDTSRCIKGLDASGGQRHYVARLWHS
jgi:hypothetical protein